MLAFSARRSLLELSFQVLDSAALPLDYVFDMRNAVEVDLELVHLSHDVLKARDLGIGIVYEIPCAVVLLEGDNGALFTEVLNPLLDLLHEPVKMS